MAKVAAVTGYKAHELGIFSDEHPGLPYIKKTLEKRIRSLADEGLEWVIITGQLGVELWAGETVIGLKDEYPDLKLAFITPFLEQEEKWSENNQEYYQLIQSQADFTDSITRRKYENPGQFQLKNDFLVHKCDMILVLYDEERGGSPGYIVEAARKMREEKPGPELMFITPFDIDETIRDEQENNPDFWNG
ncbi:DUF1273 domain-containing protein [Bacillus marinisedimentorum]|uniref:DUF1273 domain-containing protein n=1 Tax=Bacillus marinisedimentorum TaxID=1821260 RepID=UPI0007DF566A|nr:DUF1273 domain-containing protein [Bacillus marinisedimentorum]